MRTFRVARETGAGLAVGTEQVESKVAALEFLLMPERSLAAARGAWSAVMGIFIHSRFRYVFYPNISQAISRRIGHEMVK